MNAPKVAFTLILAALNEGGATVDAEGNNANDFPGFVVGGKVPTFVVEGQPLSSEVIAWVRANPSGFYGVWKDSATGFFHFDAVDLIGDKAEAIRLGIERGELAIWDGKAGEEIRMDGVQDWVLIEPGLAEPDEFAGHYDESGY